MNVNRPVTGRDVARRAGVSQSAVSLALRDDPRITPATRDRIKHAARELGYTPSQIGRSLSTRRTGRIGVLTAELTNPFYPALLAPLHDRLHQAGYSTVLVGDDRHSRTDLMPLFDGSLDGVVLTASDVGSTVPAALERTGLPYVLLNRTVDGVQADAVGPDNESGATAVADLLAGLGHRRIGVLAGPATTSTARDRLAAFRRRLTDHGLRIPAEHVVTGPFSHEAGADGLRQLLARRRPPTAVFCGNDVIALGALNAAIADRVPVPGELTLVGFDDIPAAAWPALDLTTVRADLAQMAGRAADLLLRRIADRFASPTREIVPVQLVLRGTHAAPV